jgi:hypothetical protein
VKHARSQALSAILVSKFLIRLFSSKCILLMSHEHISINAQVATSESVESPPTAAFLRTLTTAMHLDAGGAGLLEGLVSKVGRGLDGMRMVGRGWVGGVVG